MNNVSVEFPKSKV